MTQPGDRGATGRDSGVMDDVEDLPLEDVIEIQGDVPPDKQDAVLEPDELEHHRTATMSELDGGYSIPDLVYAADEAAVLESLESLQSEDLREGETDDPGVAAEEGLAYVPPIDPPVIADPEAEDGIVPAAGIGISADSEPYDDSHRGIDLDPESELNLRIREALRADSQTSVLEDRLIIGTRGSVAVIRGVVDDVYDSDAIIEVVSRVKGITDVIDETELAN
ncbi:MAG TPA: BON domain-containing protein [Candidatus Limnocylindrales bacterium]|nr:BON domain-containing protein [Candidatus Limnocylindrales bacterium]